MRPRILLGAVLLVLTLVPLVGARAQQATSPPPPTTTATARPAATVPPPSATPTPVPEPTPAPLAPSSPPAAQPAASATPSPTPAPKPVIPKLERTPPRNTATLVELLRPLTEWGMALDEVLIEGMGRFPVTGVAYYTDDWLAPRYTPSFHLHRGLDIFADFGTSVIAPTAGVVTRFSDAYPGGTSVTMEGHDGTTYYFAHLLARAEQLAVGQSVETGTLLGYVGNTGNAEGGAPHLHFEIRRDGWTIRPKPIVDGWLDEAESTAGDWIEARRVQIEQARSDTGTTIADPLVLLLLDTVHVGP